jgi:hypothetical protein
MLAAPRSRGFIATPTLASLAIAFAFLFVPARASAQSVIKQPGNHPDYSVEIEPHIVFQWTNHRWGDDAFGPGARFSIPFLDNGPISKINNNMAIGFGLDVTFGDNDCGWWFRDRRGNFDRGRFGNDCNVTEFWFPVVLQWNFFFTDVISVFGEPGFAIAHRRWDWEWVCPDGFSVCDYDDSDTDVEFVFWGGGRFMFSDTVGAVVRIGTPSISAGITFLL